MYYISRIEAWQAFACLLFAWLGAVVAIGGVLVYGSELEALVESGAHEGVMVVGVGLLLFVMMFSWPYIIFLAKDLQEMREFVSYDELARLEYGRMLWRRPETRSRLLAHWTDPRRPYRERFLRQRKWIERLLETSENESESGSAFQEELLAHGMSLRALTREIPPVFGAFWPDSAHVEAEDEE